MACIRPLLQEIIGQLGIHLEFSAGAFMRITGQPGPASYQVRIDGKPDNDASLVLITRVVNSHDEFTQCQRRFLMHGIHGAKHRNDAGTRAMGHSPHEGGKTAVTEGAMGWGLRLRGDRCHSMSLAQRRVAPDTASDHKADP